MKKKPASVVRYVLGEGDEAVSREIDRLVAEKAFNLSVKEVEFPEHQNQHGSSVPKDIGSCDHPGRIYGNINEPWAAMFWKIPNFSTSISDAWLVVEKMRLHIFPVKDGWCAGVSVDREITHGFKDAVVAETAPEAICLAALKALSVPVPKQGGGEVENE